MMGTIIAALADIFSAVASSLIGKDKKD